MLTNILTESMIKTNVKVDSWRQAVKVVGDLLVNNTKVKSEFIKSMIDVVEEFGPYIILVPEVAFFHGKPGKNVHEPCLSLAVFNQPVYFTEYENQKIKCAFGFGATDNESHLSMLVEMTNLLQDETFINLITNNGSKDEILRAIKKMEKKNNDSK